MLKIGDFNTLKVVRCSRGGCFLESGVPEQAELYLPIKEAPPGILPGQSISVFVFNDSKQKLGATTGVPLAKPGDFATLTVKDVTSFGAFLDWGISKDLFLPRKYWDRPLHKGERVVVFLKLDYEQRGVIGTCEVEQYLSKETEVLQPNQRVRLLLYSVTRLGYKVVINNQFPGLLYHGDIFESLQIGDERPGYIKKVREDGQVDVVLQPQGFKPSSDAASEKILAALRKSDGFLPLHDKSEPEVIYARLQMSKKLFKKTIGVLYREGTVELLEDGIRLTSQNGP